MKLSSQTRKAQMLGQPGVLGKLPELAVDRHEVAGPDQVQDQLHLLDAAVTGDVQRRIHGAVDARPRRGGTCGRSSGKMAFSLPGMMRELRATVSPLSSEMCLWLSTATRESADMGSPCVPEMSTVTLFGGRSIASCGRSRMPSGISRSPRECAISVTETMLRPITATRRLNCCGKIEHQLNPVDGGAEAGDDHAACRRG